MGRGSTHTRYLPTLVSVSHAFGSDRNWNYYVNLVLGLQLASSLSLACTTRHDALLAKGDNHLCFSIFKSTHTFRRRQKLRNVLGGG